MLTRRAPIMERAAFFVVAGYFFAPFASSSARTTSFSKAS